MGINATAAASPDRWGSNVTSANDQEYVPDQIIIQFNPSSSSNEQLQSQVYHRISDQTGLSIQIVDESRITPGLELVEVTNCKNLAKTIKIFQNQPEILYAEKNYILEIQKIPDDTYYGELWGLNNTGQKDHSGYIGKIGADISAQNAWDITTGSENVIVAVIDSGVDITHPDLVNNIWTNPNEIPNNGIDDDNNGFIDDVNGWNFFDDNNDISDKDGHGTHVAGIIGAVGNNGLGVTGVAWNIKIMPVRLGAKNWTSYMEVQAVNYATKMGAAVINCSYGGQGFSEIEKTAYENSTAVIICAAGNETNDNDIKPSYPCNYKCPNIVSVAATNNRDQLAEFSNYGKNSVHLAAPGDEIYSTYPQKLVHKGNLPYRYMSGTSMAAPYVSGVAALIKAVNSSLNNVQIKDILLNSVDPLNSLKGKVSTGGRLNANQAVINAQSSIINSAVATVQSMEGPQTAAIGE